MDFPPHHGVDPGDDVKVVHEIAHVLRQVLRHLLVHAVRRRRRCRVCLTQACLQPLSNDRFETLTLHRGCK